MARSACLPRGHGFPTQRISIGTSSSGYRQHSHLRLTVRSAPAAAVDQVPSITERVPPAVLPGTPKSFGIPSEKLIELAKKLEASNGGVNDDSLLADDFRFEFPVISLTREEYLKAVRGFNLALAFPDLATNAYDFRVDKYEPNRVWFTTRFTATHTGPLKFGNSTYEATGKTVQSAPEAISYTFNEEGKCTSYTGGYQMDRRVGNTKNLGAIFGVLAAIGVPVPVPGSLGFKIAQALNRVRTLLAGLFS